MMKKLWGRLIPLFLALALLAGCSGGAAVGPYAELDAPGEVEIDDVAVPLAGAPDAGALLLPVASGTKTQKNSRATIDYSNIQDGYVMVKCSGAGKKLMVQVFGPSYQVDGTKYTYVLTPDVWTTFPLSDGNGSYTVNIMENTTGKKYAKVLEQGFSVSLTDEFAPFLRPNQYVDYGVAPQTIAMAAELAGDETDPLKLVEVVYNYVVKNFSYDKKLAASVQSGYLPVLDNVLAAKKGICFDYAGVMTGMLRSLGVPCKLVVGYAGKTYHAWVNVWTEESGWVEAVVYFDGSTWQRMDPTYASTGKGSQKIMAYIGDGSNYNPMYTY